MFINFFISATSNKDFSSPEISKKHWQEIFRKSINETENSNFLNNKNPNLENLDFNEFESGDIIVQNARKESHQVLTGSVTSLSDFKRGDSQNLYFISKKNEIKKRNFWIFYMIMIIINWYFKSIYTKL